MHQHFSELSSINFQDDNIKKSHDKLVDSTEKKNVDIILINSVEIDHKCIICRKNIYICNIACLLEKYQKFIFVLFCPTFFHFLLKIFC